MLADYKIARSTRRCAELDRPLQPGETYWTAVIERYEELTRIDVSQEAWKGAPEGALACWKNRMPAAGQQKLKLAPDAVLVSLLHQWESEPAREHVRFLLALLLLRRRVVKVVESTEPVAGQMELEIALDGTRVAVTECSISPAAAQRLQAELTELLFCEAE